MPVKVAISFLVFLLAVAGCATTSTSTSTSDSAAAFPDEFELQRQQAVKDSETPEARAYERDFYPAIGEDLTRLLQKCTAEFPASEVDSFEMVFKVDHWGEPKAILVNPNSEVPECVARGFWYFTFPHPAQRFEETGLVLLMPIRIN